MGLRPSINAGPPLVEMYINTAYDTVVAVYESLGAIQSVADFLALPGVDGSMLVYNEETSYWDVTNSIKISPTTNLVTVYENTTFTGDITVGSSSVVTLGSSENAIDASTGALRLNGGLSVSQDIFLAGCLTAGTIAAGNTTITGDLRIV